MLSLEEYIEKRKAEDKINELDFERRFDNIKICVNYVLDYFTKYTGITEQDNKTAVHGSKLDKFKNTIRLFSPECQEWLCNIYDRFELNLTFSINKAVRQGGEFLLFYNENEFRELTYDCYNIIIKRLPYIKGQGEMLFKYIREYHHIQSEPHKRQSEFFKIHPSITEWISFTYQKYLINIPAFVEDYCNCFYKTFDESHNGSWKKGNVKIHHEEICYNYKDSRNLLNINDIYEKHINKPFIKSYKHKLEILLMFYWTRSIEGDHDYWKGYSTNALQYL